MLKLKKYKIIFIINFIILCAFSQPSSEYTNTTKSMHDYIIDYLSVFDNLEYEEVLAVIFRESNGKADLISYEKNVNDYSYGPMQVRGKTLRWLGFTGDFNKILNYEDGIYWGMKYLSLCKSIVKSNFIKNNIPYDKHLIRRMTFAMYNAGGVYWLDGKEGNEYINNNYVRSCEWNYWNMYKQVRKYKLVNNYEN